MRDKVNIAAVQMEPTIMENKENLNEDTKKDLKSIYESSERIKKIVANANALNGTQK